MSQHKNRLSKSLSPYLLQHADNPVDWFPWGEEAFEKARIEAKPIFLSIGYAACHWCHVMAHESFENQDVADYMNQHFVSIKVDREEHPDVDEIYMTAVQMMTGSGGWPLSVFLTADLKPFYGGTYFPPDDRYGRPGFLNLLKQISDFYENKHDQIDRSLDQIMKGLMSTSAVGKKPGDYSPELVTKAVHQVGANFDPYKGGFGPAPKFPPTGQLDLLMRAYNHSGDDKLLIMVERTLKKMAEGGIYDQIGGGFHRYSTDAEWLVPHFEKMLYDNALLTLNYLDLYLITGKTFYADIARQTLDWVLREMKDADGGFYSSLDADSEGEEGIFYVWENDQVDKILGEDDAKLFREVYGVSEPGNFENQRNILHIAIDPEVVAERNKIDVQELNKRLAVMRDKLSKVREQRIRPGTDDKVLTDWNGLMIAAFSRGFRVLGDEKYLNAATEAINFFMENMWQDDNLLHSYRQGESGINGLLDDYAFLLNGLNELYQAGFHPKRLSQAEKIAERMIDLFWDEESGGFYHVPAGRTDLIFRQKQGYDGAIPSGNAFAAKALLDLFQLTDRDDFREYAVRTVRAFVPMMESHPTGHLRLASIVEGLTTSLEQIAIVGTGGRGSGHELLKAVNSVYKPNAVIVYSANPDGDGIELLKGRFPINDKPAVYYCRDFTCKAPVTETEDLLKLLNN